MYKHECIQVQNFIVASQSKQTFILDRVMILMGIKEKFSNSHVYMND